MTAERTKQPAPFCYHFQLSADSKKWETFEMVLGTADGDHIHLTQNQAKKLNLQVLPEDKQDNKKKTRFGYPAVQLEPIRVSVLLSDKITTETFEVKSVFLIPPATVKGIEDWTEKVRQRNRTTEFVLLAEKEEKQRLAEQMAANPPVPNPAAVPASAAAAAAAGIVVAEAQNVVVGAVNVVRRPAAAAAAAAIDIAELTAEGAEATNEAVSTLLNPARRGGSSIIQNLF